MANKIKKEVFEPQFIEVIGLIKRARINALKSVNKELINLYWKIGEYISKRIENSEWGESVIEQLAEYIRLKHPELKGYSSKSLWRMNQFYKTYCPNRKLAPLVRELSWTHNRIILAKAKTNEEREFYLRLAIKEKYSKRELERQIDSGFYERTMLSQKLSTVLREIPKVSPLVSQIPEEITSAFKDMYILDFLDLPQRYSEKDFRKAIISNFKEFVLEFGKDFAFVGEEYRLSIGNNDFFIDLLFYHRELRCLVAFELKIDDFKPEYLGKMNFYLEAIDRDVKKAHENPSVGVILCKSKDKEVVEYALKRSMSPALISEYKTKLIPKELLQKKMLEFFEANKIS